MSRIVELEALSLGVHGKLALWRTLRALDLAELSSAPIPLVDLVVRAEQQLAGLSLIASRRSHRPYREVDGHAARPEPGGDRASVRLREKSRHSLPTLPPTSRGRSRSRRSTRTTRALGPWLA
jgi:hypothetical protein